MTRSQTGLSITTSNHCVHGAVMDLLDELDMLEDRQDLSQYSYDPEDRLETVTFPDSQQSSQASDKTDVFLGVYDDQKATDNFDVDDVLSCLDRNNDTQSEDTGELRDCLSLTGVTSWLANAEVDQVSTTQEFPSVSSFGDTCPQPFEVKVLIFYYHVQY